MRAVPDCQLTYEAEQTCSQEWNFDLTKFFFIILSTQNHHIKKLLVDIVATNKSPQYGSVRKCLTA